MIQESCSLVFTKMSWMLRPTQKPIHLIHNCQNLETTKCFSRWMDRQNVVHTCLECYYAIKRNELLNQVKTLGDVQSILLNERRLNRLHIIWLQLHDTMEKAKWREWKYQWKKEGWRSGIHGGFKIVKLLCMRLPWWMYDSMHLSKPTNVLPEWTLIIY